MAFSYQAKAGSQAKKIKECKANIKEKFRFHVHFRSVRTQLNRANSFSLFITSTCLSFCSRGGVSQHAMGRGVYPSMQRAGGVCPGGVIDTSGQTPPGQILPPPTETATEAGGAHPTGMHSCSFYFYFGDLSRH